MMGSIYGNTWVLVSMFFIYGVSSYEIQKIEHNGLELTFNLSTPKRNVFDNTAVWTLESDEDGNLKANSEGIAKIDGTIYEDTDSKAVLVKKKNCDENCWDGIYGLGTTREVIDSQKKLASTFPSTGKKYGGRYHLQHANFSRTSNSLRTLAKSISIPDKFFAKLLVIMDNALFVKLGNDVERATKYLNVFWTAVDLQYRNVSSPHIEIRITGIILAKNDKALSYVTENSPDGKKVNIDKVLYGVKGNHEFVKKTTINNYDAIVTMTGLNGFIESGGWEYDSDGATFNASICNEKFNFSVMRDDGSYFGIHSAIHEVAHLFGVEHDGEFTGNGAGCYIRDRESLPIMWGSYLDRKYEYWSDCSLKALRVFTENEDKTWCIRQEEHIRS